MEPNPDIDKNSLISGQIQKLSEQIESGEEPNQQTLKELGDFSPQEITAAIFDKPPHVRGFETILDVIETNPPAEANLEITIPDVEFSDYYALAVRSIRGYLTAPAIQDSFLGNHLHRRDYQEGVYQVLKALDKSKNTKDTEGSYLTHFSTAWDINRYSTNHMDKVYNGILTILSFPLDSATELELQTLIQDYKNLGTAPYIDPKDPEGRNVIYPMDSMNYKQLDQKVLQVEDIAKRAIRVLASTSA